MTVSHLRFGPRPIRSTYLIRAADFVACHQFDLLERHRRARSGRARRRRSCSTARTGPTRSGSTSRADVQEQIVDKGLRVLRGRRPARGARGGLGGRDQHRPADVLLRAGRRARRSSEAIGRDQERDREAYGKRGADRGGAELRRGRPRAGRRCTRSTVPDGADGDRAAPARRAAPRRRTFVQRVTAVMIAGRGRPAAGVSAIARRRDVPDRHGPVGEAVASPARSRSGTRRSASTAPSARWSAPTRRSA